MWDLIVSVPDHCLSFYFVKGYNIYQYLFFFFFFFFFLAFSCALY